MPKAKGKETQRRRGKNRGGRGKEGTKSIGGLATERGKGGNYLFPRALTDRKRIKKRGSAAHLTRAEMGQKKPRKRIRIPGKI